MLTGKESYITNCYNDKAVLVIIHVIVIIDASIVFIQLFFYSIPQLMLLIKFQYQYIKD